MCPALHDSCTFSGLSYPTPEILSNQRYQSHRFNQVANLGGCAVAVHPNLHHPDPDPPIDPWLKRWQVNEATWAQGSPDPAAFDSYSRPLPPNAVDLPSDPDLPAPEGERNTVQTAREGERQAAAWGVCRALAAIEEALSPGVGLCYSLRLSAGSRRSSVDTTRLSPRQAGWAALLARAHKTNVSGTLRGLVDLGAAVVSWSARCVCGLRDLLQPLVWPSSAPSSPAPR